MIISKGQSAVCMGRGLVLWNKNVHTHGSNCVSAGIYWRLYTGAAIYFTICHLAWGSREVPAEAGGAQHHFSPPFKANTKVRHEWEPRCPLGRTWLNHCCHSRQDTLRVTLSSLPLQRHSSNSQEFIRLCWDGAMPTPEPGTAPPCKGTSPGLECKHHSAAAQHSNSFILAPNQLQLHSGCVAGVQSAQGWVSMPVNEWAACFTLAGDSFWAQSKVFILAVYLENPWFHKLPGEILGFFCNTALVKLNFKTKLEF